MLPPLEGGVPGMVAPVVALGDVAPTAIAFSRAEEMPLAEGVALPSSLGVAGLERCGATSSGSTRSGGRRSFSISDLRLSKTLIRGSEGYV